MSKISEKIRQFRTELHLSQDYVAKFLNMSRTTYTQLENGNRKITVDDITNLCNIFGVSSDSLLDLSEPVKPTAVFARSFENLDETDQMEIINLIRFKEQMKSQRNIK